MPAILLHIIFGHAAMRFPVAARGDIAVKTHHQVTEATDPDGLCGTACIPYAGITISLSITAADCI